MLQSCTRGAAMASRLNIDGLGSQVLDLGCHVIGLGLGLDTMSF